MNSSAPSTIKRRAASLLEVLNMADIWVYVCENHSCPARGLVSHANICFQCGKTRRAQYINLSETKHRARYQGEPSFSVVLICLLCAIALVVLLARFVG